MEFIKKLISSEDYNRIISSIPLVSILSTEKLILKIDKTLNDIDHNDLHMNTEQFTKFTEIKYWLQLIEYDITSTCGCLIYLKHKADEVIPVGNNSSTTLLEVQDFSFFFDSAISKFISLIDRVAQFMNCLFCLELIEDKLGPKGVSIKNVIKKLEEKKLLPIKDCIVNIDLESEKMRKIRNAIIHHFHPFNSSFYKQSTMKGVLNIDKANLRANTLIDKTIITSIQESFEKINDMINMLVGVAVGFFKIDCVLIKNNIVVDEARLIMNFDS